MRGKVEKNKNSKTVRKFSEMIKRDGSTEKGKGSNTVEQRKKERERERKKENVLGCHFVSYICTTALY